MNTRGSSYEVADVLSNFSPKGDTYKYLSTITKCEYSQKFSSEYHPAVWGQPGERTEMTKTQYSLFAFWKHLNSIKILILWV